MIRKDPIHAYENVAGIPIEEIERIYPNISDVSDFIQCVVDISLDIQAFKYFKALKLKNFYSKEGLIRYNQYRKEYGTISNTLDYYRVLYPENVANQYYLMNKASRSNVYDPSYISERDSISLEEAQIQIEEYKAKKATSKKNFISKYGEVEGMKRFEEFKSKSLASSYDKDTWIRMNNATEKDWFKRRRCISKRCTDYWIHKFGMSFDEAKKAVSDHQKNNSGVFYEYYERLGYDRREILEILSEISQRKDGSSFDGIRRKYPNLSYDEVLDRYNNICRSKSVTPTTETLAKIRKTLEDNGHWVPYELLTEYEKYKQDVMKITRKQDTKNLISGKNIGKAGVHGAFQIDHEFSIKEGFMNNIDPKIIGNISNLRCIPWQENLQKSYHCSITKDELLDRYYRRYQ